jgi:hypothetical protein
MTEWFPATIDILLDDLIDGRVSAWQRWSIGSRNSDSTYYIIDAVGNVRYGQDVFKLALVFPFVDIGAQRIGVTVPASMPKAVAFENPDGKQVVVVKKAPDTGNQTFGLSGLQPGMYGVRHIAEGGASFIDLPTITVAANGTAQMTFMPGHTTLYGLTP